MGYGTGRGAVRTSHARAVGIHARALVEVLPSQICGFPGSYMATGVSPWPWRAICFWGIIIADLGRVAGFRPTSSPPNINWARHHEHFQHRTQRPSPRCWHPSSSSAMAKMKGAPPDDFIDTTAEDEPGSERLAVDFERQELRVIFETMDKNNIFYKMLAEEQIVEILQLTQALLSVKKMPQDISKLCEGDMMKGKWKLDFSTEERYKFLPPTSDVYNYIYDGGGGGRLDNVLRFYKSWAVKSVRAVTNYKMDGRGKISFEFDRIEADLFGFKVPLPNFNADAGFVEVQYFDGDLWIEAFEADTTMTESGKMTVVNIYRRIGDVTEEDKVHVPERTGEQRQPRR